MDIEEFKPKTFWERPEGWTGMFTIGILALAGVFIAGPFLMGVFSTLITLLGQGIAITILGTVLFGLIMVLSNKRFQTATSYLFKSVMRTITGWVVVNDAIGIMKSYVDDAIKKRSTMEEARGKLRGEIAKGERQLSLNQAQYDSEMAKAAKAKEMGKMDRVQVSGRQALRLEKMNKTTLIPLVTQMKIHLKALDKYHEVTGVFIDDMQNEISAQKMQRDAMRTSHSAMMTAKKILQGGAEGKELYDLSLEFLVHDYDKKMGEIENFVISSRDFVEGIDLENAVFDDEALKRLQEWENKADSILLGNGKAQLLEHTTASNTLQHGIGAPAVQQVDYSELISSRRK